MVGFMFCFSLFVYVQICRPSPHGGLFPCDFVSFSYKVMLSWLFAYRNGLSPSMWGSTLGKTCICFCQSS